MRGSERASKVRWQAGGLVVALALFALPAALASAINQPEKSPADKRAKRAGISAKQLATLPERVIVQRGLATMVGRVISIDAREVRVVESVSDPYDALLAGLPVDMSESLSSAAIDESLIVALPIEQVLAIMPQTLVSSPAGLWAYVPGRATSATHRGADAHERDRERRIAAAVASRDAMLRRQLQLEDEVNASAQIQQQPQTLLVPGTLQLVDGQLLTGSLVLATIGRSPPADTLLWSCTLLPEGQREVHVPLEQVRLLQLHRSDENKRAASAPVDASIDRAVLANGDALEGFASAVWENGRLALAMEAQAGAAVRVPAERLTSLRLAEDAATSGQHAQAGNEGMLVWLADQTVRATALAIEGDQALLGWAGVEHEKKPAEGTQAIASVRLAASSIRAIAVQPAAITGLALLPVVSTACGDGRRWCPPLVVSGQVSASLGAADIELPGPMSVTMSLPQDARTIAAIAELPESCRELGTCDLVVLVGEEGKMVEAARLTLSGANPVQPLRVELAANKQSGAASAKLIMLTLEAGADGSVQDRVLLRGGLVESAR